MNEVDWSNNPEWAIGVGYSHKHGDWQWFDHGHYMHHKGGVKCPFNTSFCMDDLVGMQLTCVTPKSEYLPQVGTVCELANYDQDYIEVEILFIGNVYCIVKDEAGSEQHYYLSSVKFRPKTSGKDQFADAVKKYLSKMYPEKSVPAFTIFMDIYDGMVDGSLPIPKGAKK